MPGPDKKEMDKAKKAIAGEVKKLAQKTKKQTEEAKKLIAEKEKAKKQKAEGPEAKKAEKEIDLKISKLNGTVQKEADKTARKISLMIKDYRPPDADVPEWQKGMAGWYTDILKKEPGLKVGNARVNGEISVKDKKAIITVEWKLK